LETNCSRRLASWQMSWRAGPPVGVVRGRARMRRARPADRAARRPGAQDELVQALRSEGRRQAAQRMLRIKRDGQILLTSNEGYESE